MATEEEQCEQRKALHEREQIAMDAECLVLEQFSDKLWLFNRSIKRKGITTKGTIRSSKEVCGDLSRSISTMLFYWDAYEAALQRTNGHVP